jgi:hypothetical protein
MRRRTFLSLPGAAALATAQETVLDLGSRRELFLDRFLIDRMAGAELSLQQPIEREAALVLNRPWEGAFCGYFTVIHDGPVYHLYYRGVPTAGQDGRSEEVTCYARSTDGVRWTRPALGLFLAGGTRDNNVILAGQPPFSHNFCPFLDTRPGVPERERFKALAGTKESGLAGFISPDGVHWKRLRAEPLLPPSHSGTVYDSQNVAFWSAAEQRYLCYFRTFKEIPGMGKVRWVSRATSPDFLQWSEGREMSFGDAPPEHIYTNQTSPYFRAPHLSVSIAARFMPGRQAISDAEAATIGVHPEYFHDCSDGVLLTTRGGLRYDRTFLEGFLRPGVGLEHWVSRDNYPGLNVVPTGAAEMSLYVNRRYGQPSAYLARYTLRTDGFASLRAPYAGGEMISKPIRFSGRQLELNYATSAAGFVRVELQSAQGGVIDGYRLEDCRELIGDRIARTVTWKGGDLAALAGKAVRLRLQLKDAEVFSFRFGEASI